MFIHSFDDMPENSKICLYGKGSRALHLEKFMKLFRKDVEIICAIDSAGLENFLKTREKYDFIVVASVYWIEIKAILDKHGLTNYKILANEFAGFMQGYWDYTEKNGKYQEKVPEVLDMFKLEKHRELYRLLYDYQTDNEAVGKIIKYSVENLDNLKNHYLEFLVRDKIETYIDGGVFDGTSTNRLINSLKNVKNVFGFEPLMHRFNFNYPEFVDTGKLSRFEVYPEGLWHRSETLGFSICNGGSKIEARRDAAESINTIALDEFVQKNNVPKIDFIKMDIENAELNALKGGINTIRKDRPQLAVCIYHSLEQFVEVPLFLKSCLEGYSFYPGHYSCSKNETVLYAIPGELENQ